MSNDAEFQELEKRVAELTQRTFRLEQQLATGRFLPGSVPGASPKQVATQPIPVGATPPPPKSAAPLSHADALNASMQQRLKHPPDAPTRDLESRIGSQWLNRIGILAMMTGAAYFLKLAFDNDWVGPSGRVAIGLIVGIGLVAWSSRIHKRGYLNFSYSLTALGIGIMYLSLWAAFQLYQLIPAPVAFIAMIAVTASAAILALRQNTQILAAVAIAGGFSTPLLLSTGQNRPMELFLYIAMLNVFSIVLVALRPWRRLLFGSFVGTVVFYSGWYVRFYNSTQKDVAAGFATLFFVQFAILPLIKHLHAFNDQQWHRSQTFVFVALFNPVVYFIELFAIYEATNRDGLSWAAVVLGAFYIVISKQLVPDAVPEADSDGIGPLHRWLHLAIAVTFLTVAIPLRLRAHWVTMGWFVESAVLLYIGERLKINFLKRAAIVALALGVVRMLFIDTFHTHTLIFNSRFATYALAIAVLFAIAWQAHKEKGSDHAPVVLSTIFVNVLALLALNAEVADFYSRSYQQLGYNTAGYRDWNVARDFTYSALWMIYGAMLMFVGFWRNSQALRWQALALIAFTIAKVFLYDLSSLSGPLRVLSFVALGALLMGISFVYQRDWLKLSAKGKS